MDPHPLSLQRNVLRAVVGYHAQRVEHQAGQGVMLLLVQLDAKCILQIVQFYVAGDDQGAILPLFDAGLIIVRNVAVVAAQVAHQLLNQVVQRHDAHHAAVLVQHHGQGIAGTLHVAEQGVGLNGLRHEVRRADGAGHYALPTLIRQAEVLLGVQNAHHIVRTVLAHGVAGVPRVVDGLGPIVHGVVQPQQIHIRAVGGDLFGGQVVKLKDVLDELLFLMVDAAVLAAGVHHHADVLLAHLLLGLVGINAQQPQYAVGRRAQQPHNGREQLGDDSDEPGDVQRYLLRLLHGNALGHQLAEHQREEGQDQRDQDHGEGVQRGGGDRYAQPHQPVHQRIGEILRREGAAQKARQGDGHLNSGQEPGRLGRQPAEPLGLPITLRHHFAQLHLVYRQHGDLRAGEHGVQGDKHHL